MKRGKSFYECYRRTNKESVVDFFTKVVSYLKKGRITRRNVVIVLDNHSAHKSIVVRELCARHKITLLFTARYSSPLNPIEHIWSAVKSRWKKFLASKTDKYVEDNMPADITRVARQVQVSRRLDTSMRQVYERVKQRNMV